MAGRATAKAARSEARAAAGAIVMQTMPPAPSTSGLPLGERIKCRRCGFYVATRILTNPHQVEAVYKGGAFHWPSLPWSMECPRCREPQVVR